jgi:Tfp pilus assembly protein PilW
VPVVEISHSRAGFRASMSEAGKRAFRMFARGRREAGRRPISPARHFVMFDQPESFVALDHALEPWSNPLEMTAGYSGAASR